MIYDMVCDLEERSRRGEGEIMKARPRVYTGGSTMGLQTGSSLHGPAWVLLNGSPYGFIYLYRHPSIYVHLTKGFECRRVRSGGLVLCWSWCSCSG